MGASAVPRSRLLKMVRLLPYMPPRSQMVSPGLTAAGPLRAVARSHGRAMLPSPVGAPLGAAYHWFPVPVTGGAAATVSVTFTVCGEPVAPADATVTAPL